MENTEKFRNIWFDLKMRCDKHYYEVNVQPLVDDINLELKLLGILKRYPGLCYADIAYSDFGAQCFNGIENEDAEVIKLYRIKLKKDAEVLREQGFEIDLKKEEMN